MNDDEVLGVVRTLLQQERWEEAIAKAGVLDEDAGAELTWSVGWAHFQLGRYEDAVTYLRRAVDSGGVDHVHYGSLGMAFLKLGKHADAELWLLRALAVRDSSQSRFGLALIYLKEGLEEDAEAIHKEGLRLQPNDPERHDGYADFLSDVGREDEAKTMYERAAALNKGGEG